MRQTLWGFIRKELTQTLRDPRMRVLLFVVPAVQLTLFGVGISTEVKNVKLAAFFHSNDTVLREVYEHAIASQWFIPAEGTGSPYDLIRSGKADAVLVAPPHGFTRDLVRGDAKLQLLINATNVIQAQSVEMYLRSITQTEVEGYRKSSASEPPIQFDMRVLFNPDLNTAIFMVPGTMCMLMIITTLIMTNNAIVREKELGTFEMLISAPVSSFEVILGKTIPYVVLGLAQFPMVLAVAMVFFHVPQRGSYVALGLSTLAFVCTSVALGTLISTFCENQQQANLAGFLFLFPAIMFSGLMFPVQNMPKSIQWVAFLDPIAHYMGLLRNIMLKGGDPRYIIAHIGYLSIMAVISVMASFKRFHTTLQ